MLWAVSSPIVDVHKRPFHLIIALHLRSLSEMYQQLPRPVSQIKVLLLLHESRACSTGSQKRKTNLGSDLTQKDEQRALCWRASAMS